MWWDDPESSDVSGASVCCRWVEPFERSWRVQGFHVFLGGWVKISEARVFSIGLVTRRSQGGQPRICRLKPVSDIFGIFIGVEGLFVDFNKAGSQLVNFDQAELDE